MTMPDAIVALVRAAVPGVDVFDGRVPDDEESTPLPERYAAVYADDGTLDAVAVCQRSDDATFRWQVTSVAPDRGMASWLATRIRDALVDVRPAADGWNPGQIEHTFSQLPRPDEQVRERPVVVAIDQYALVAERLPS